MSLKLFFPDAATRKNDFAIGEIFEKEWGQRKKGIMHTNCSLPESNKMFCVLEERERGWNLTEEFDFSKVHMRVVCTHSHLLTSACLHLLFSVCTCFFQFAPAFFSLHLLCFQFVCIYFRLISHFIPFHFVAFFPFFLSCLVFIPILVLDMFQCL